MNLIGWRPSAPCGQLGGLAVATVTTMAPAAYNCASMLDSYGVSRFLRPWTIASLPITSTVRLRREGHNCLMRGSNANGQVQCLC